MKEGLDASASLFTLDGTTLAQACAIPIHLATLIPAVAEIQRAFPADTMQDGDIYLLNDPYCGGTHLPDIAVVVPVFARGRLLALAATMTHHQDVGGLAAGSVPTNATEIFQEGLRIPAIRWARGGVLDPMITAILRQNVRIPDIFMGDLHAQIAACRIACIRLQQTAQKYGHNSLTNSFALLIERAETMTLAALREIPDGTYRHVDWLDNDGIELDRRHRPFGSGQVLARLRHHLRRGAAPLRRVDVHLRAAVPRPDGAPAGRRHRQLLPAVALEAKNAVRNARSTVGTITETHDVLRLALHPPGRGRCPNGHGPARSYTPEEAAAALAAGAAGDAFTLVVAPAPAEAAAPTTRCGELIRQGFQRRLERRRGGAHGARREVAGEARSAAARPRPLPGQAGGGDARARHPRAGLPDERRPGGGPGDRRTVRLYSRELSLPGLRRGRAAARPRPSSRSTRRSAPARPARASAG